MRKTRIAPLACFAAAQLFACAPIATLAATKVSAKSCESLKGKTFAGVSITSATLVQPPFKTPDNAYTTFTVPMFPPELLPSLTADRSFCRALGAAHPSSDSNINVEIWLPDSDWNGKFYGAGNSGLWGAIQYWDMVSALSRGYAAAASDMGHVATGPEEDGKWAIGHPEKVKDWAFRATHITAEAGKATVAAFYGVPPAHSYFMGCSNGGHQALTEAQRYPSDYDGIIAGCGAANVTHIVAQQIWNAQANSASLPTAIPPAKLPALAGAVLGKCDAKDGLQDGQITDPRECDFDPASIQCAAGHDANDCLTADQVATAKRIYAGPSNPRTGVPIAPGAAKGTEMSWAYHQAQPRPGFSDVFSAFVYGDANWDWTKFNFDSDMAFVDSKISYVNAADTNLKDFHAKKGRLLIYHHSGDSLISAQEAINYYEGVLRDSGKSISESVRLLLVPAAEHCAPLGSGPTEFDRLGALEKWVEKGMAPDVIVASKYKNFDKHQPVVRTRPICAYPKFARYKGAGSIDDAANFECH